MSALTILVLGFIYNLTGNIGVTVIIVASVMFLFKRRINMDKEHIRDIEKKMNDPLVDEKVKMCLCKTLPYDKCIEMVLKILYFFVSLYIFLIIVHAKEYIPGMEEDITYPFLFIDDLFEKQAGILPTGCVFLMFILQNLFRLKKAFVDNFIKNMFKAAILILLFSLYTSMFGPIYLLYVMTFCIWGVIFDVSNAILSRKP